MITIHLHNLMFNGFHGIHDEEKLLGNDYIVDASLEFHETADVITHINETINYASVYQFIKKHMSIPTPLLETIVMKIGNELHTEYPFLKSIHISVKKLHPPIEGIQGAAGVTWEKQF
ncbi:MAG: dihydroneopterin aldolase [Bacteroidota bacterium]|jgi:7,8-dihydroneopterin aldolase/epimerase/oxygenase|nr:dihydroneopterin aldolase [Bacteroidota bacterium]